MDSDIVASIRQSHSWATQVQEKEAEQQRRRTTDKADKTKDLMANNSWILG